MAPHVIIKVKMHKTVDQCFLQKIRTKISVLAQICRRVFPANLRFNVVVFHNSLHFAPYVVRIDISRKTYSI